MHTDDDVPTLDPILQSHTSFDQSETGYPSNPLVEPCSPTNEDIMEVEGTNEGCTVDEGFNEPSSADINPSPPRDTTSAAYPVPGLSYPKSFEDRQGWRALRQGNLDDRVSNLASLRGWMPAAMLRREPRFRADGW